MDKIPKRPCMMVSIKRRQLQYVLYRDTNPRIYQMIIFVLGTDREFHYLSWYEIL